MPDAVVIGAGHNGLVAANLLADHGWEVLVLEEQSEPGGAVRSAEVTRPGFIHDLFSAFHPLSAASPVMRSLELERYGLRWRRSRGVVAHPHEDGRCALISTELDETCRSLEAFAPGDGERWRRFYAGWERAGGAFMESLLSPFPPVRAGAKLLWALRGRRRPLRFARMTLLPARRLAEETFDGEGGAWLLAGNALHADLTPDQAGGGFFGWVLCGLGQERGFPVPEGGAGELTAALVTRLRSRGGRVECEAPVSSIEVRGGRATAVRSPAVGEVPASRAVIADVGAPALYRRLLPRGAVPDETLRALRSFQYDNATVKLNWALSAPIPWRAEAARGAGTVHVAEGTDGLTKATMELLRGLIPERPFLVLGQYDPVDRSRFPEGAEAAWAYTHVPQRIRGDAAGELSGSWSGGEAERFCERMETEVERLAPGFRDRILQRQLQLPADLERSNANLVGGAINGGTAQLYQQVVFRPMASWARAATPVEGLYLGSASAHPGGGVHGACGANAARAALRRAGLTMARWPPRPS